MTTNDRAAAIDDLLATITATKPGHTATWEHRGITVTVYGQRRYEMHNPTPWAVITIAGRIRPIRTWEQILDEIDALAAE